MRSLSAHEIAISMGRTGLSPNVAILTVLDNMSKTVGGDGISLNCFIIIIIIIIIFGIVR